ncbi:MAG: RNA-binding domain-containing protein [Bacteroidota bacterium]
MQFSHIKKLIENGESETLDYKKNISSAAKIAKTFSAFANHKGGRLLVGVTDNKIISGVKSEDEKHMLETAGQFFCKPQIKVEIIEWEIGKKTLLEAVIPQGLEKPYYAKDENNKWWVYVRVGDQTLLASKIIVDVLRRNTQKRGALIKYSKHEDVLLKHLEKNEPLMLKDICKLLDISRWQAQKILVNLLSARIIRSYTTEKGEFFTTI